MKNKKLRIMKYCVVLYLYLICTTSCGLDNYDAPNATISGGIYDVETNELVQQDVIRGSVIEYIEHGFDNPENQYMIFKSDGTYQNNLIFANEYTVDVINGNFVPTIPQEVKIKGNTKLDFKVLPYIRLKNVHIEKKGEKVVANFNLQQTVSNKVKRIGLYVHIEPSVGEPMRLVATQKEINTLVNEGETQSIEIDLSENKSQLKPGEQYYFRVGALIDAPEAKFNYAPAVRIKI